MNRLIRVALAGALSVSPFLACQTEAAPPATAPTTQRSGLAVGDDVRTVLNNVRDAYRNLKSLELAGTISANFDVAGEKQTNNDTFTASFQSPNLFKHEMKDDMLVGSTGEKLYAYQAGQNLYVMKDAAKDRLAAKDLPAPLNQLIPMQNPSLALALSPDAGEELITGATSAKKIADTQVDGKSLTTLVVSDPAGEWTFLFDPQTHLLSRATLDQQAYLVKAGQSDVKLAKITFKYKTVTADGAMKEAQFAWTPPSTARDAATIASAKGGDEDPAAKLEGTAAPDFKLNDLAGKEVTLSSMKGSVVIVDFWATWCPPCVKSLPHLNQLYDEKKAAGLKVIAVSVDEDKAKVPPFVENQKLHFTVVYDSEQVKAAEKFLVQGIPETVLIGKNGKVRKVFVGFGPGSEEKLRAEVEAALKE